MLSPSLDIVLIAKTGVQPSRLSQTPSVAICLDRYAEAMVSATPEARQLQRVQVPTDESQRICIKSCSPRSFYLTTRNVGSSFAPCRDSGVARLLCMASTEQAPNQSTAVVVVDHDAGITSTGSEKPGSSTVSPTATMNDGSAASMVHDKEPPASIDVARSRFPYAIAWSPLPLITWVIPFIGHMGLCDAQGRVHDFAGPYESCIFTVAGTRPSRSR